MKNKIFLVISFVFVFLIAIFTLVKYEKFSFEISSDATKLEIRGEQKVRHSLQEDISNPSKSESVVLPQSVQGMEVNKTYGDHSPIVNNLNSKSTIIYGDK